MFFAELVNALFGVWMVVRQIMWFPEITGAVYCHYYSYTDAEIYAISCCVILENSITTPHLRAEILCMPTGIPQVGMLHSRFKTNVRAAIIK